MIWCFDDSETFIFIITSLWLGVLLLFLILKKKKIESIFNELHTKIIMCLKVFDD